MATPNTQTIAWIADLFKNEQLDLEPGYQRLSFWNQQYRDFYIDTLLNGFPSPPIFLNQEISDDGDIVYHVVDGRQRLETILGFVNNEIPVPESYECRWSAKMGRI